MGPVDTIVRQQLDLSSTSWSIGVLGALAEFHRDDGEPCTNGGTCVVTERGALSLVLPNATRAIAYEVVTQNVGTWNHGVALCLPRAECRMSARGTIAEAGEDRHAIRPQDRESILFDIGLGSPYCDFYVRTSDPGQIAVLRAAVGKSLMDCSHDLVREIPRWSPHRVFVSRLGRIEVYQPIPAHGSITPSGPHTHLLPKLLRTNRTHSANLGIPEDMVPCAIAYPANPVKDEHGNPKPFDAAEHEAFQTLYENYAEMDMRQVKRAVSNAVRSGRPPEPAAFSSRRQRLAARVTLRQLVCTDGRSPALDAWRQAFEVALR